MKPVTRDMIVGVKIKDIRLMTSEEIDALYGGMGGSPPPVIIELENGVEINAQADEENNSPGVLAFFNKKTGAAFYDWDLVKSES